MPKRELVPTQPDGCDTHDRTISESIQYFVNLRHSWWRFLSNKNASALKLMVDHHDSKTSSHCSMRSRVANFINHAEEQING